MKKILVILLLMFVVGCSSSIESVFVAPFKYKKILESINTSMVVDVNKFTIYGKYFNVEGSFEYLDGYDDIKLVLKSSDNEVAYDLIIEQDLENGLTKFKTNEKINEGINLEKVLLDNYIILLKIINDEDCSYYNLINKSSYKDLEYYTISDENKNNQIKISFSEYGIYNFMRMEIIVKKNASVCDVVIDPGHGGNDPGAVNGQYQEKDFNLVYGLMLKEALEDLGLKVGITRDRDILPKEYGVGSRTGIPYECKAKLMLSVHLNSSVANVRGGGVEIYTAYNADTAFSKVIADNIVKNTTTTYSPNKTFKVMDGVYTRTYSKNDLNDLKKSAKKDNWTMYENASTKSTYYYFIRETGGIITTALSDGRNPNYEANLYYDSNHGVEAYLLELGYISDATNLKKIINEKEGYVKGIVESVRYYINN